ncbi:MAG TPA: hypothetical protein VF715_13610 [Thermoleophilaceae bacterium]|jgi:hypothetical protein
MRSPRERLRLRRLVGFLRENGAERIDHSNESLLDHLVETREVLEGWGARRELCDAALFHSVYGTQFLGDELLGLDRRDDVRAMIGDEAEAVVWLWHGIKRESLADNLGRESGMRIVMRDETEVPITPQQFEDLVNLMVADAVEQLPRRLPENVERQQGWLTPFLPLALPEGARAAERVFERYGPGAAAAP